MVGRNRQVINPAVPPVPPSDEGADESDPGVVVDEIELELGVGTHSFYKAYNSHSGAAIIRVQRDNIRRHEREMSQFMASIQDQMRAREAEIAAMNQPAGRVNIDLNKPPNIEPPNMGPGFHQREDIDLNQPVQGASGGDHDIDQPGHGTRVVMTPTKKPAASFNRCK